MDLVIYTEGLGFDGRTPFERSLGGSESAVVFMARELARRGHRVRVFCNCAPMASAVELPKQRTKQRTRYRAPSAPLTHTAYPVSGTKSPTFGRLLQPIGSGTLATQGFAN